jgi:anti-sigma-K factor RskA
VKDQTHYPLLAGYVDGELTLEERRRIDEELGRNDELRQELAAQREAATAMDGYPVAEVEESQWRRMWQEIGGRLPGSAKRISLESLTEMDISVNMLNEEELFEQSVPVELPATPLVAVKTDTLPPLPKPSSKAAEAEKRRIDRPSRVARAQQAPLFEPLRFTRGRHGFWAHLAGLAAAVAIMAMVVLSIRPVIPETKLARAGEVVIEMEFTDASRSMIRMRQDEHGQSIPMIWIAQTPRDAGLLGSEEVIQ